MGFCYPVMLDMENKEVLIVGGGKVALRKLKRLLSAGAHVTVVAKDICSEFAQACSGANAAVFLRSFSIADIDSIRPFFVCAATDDASLNAVIASECQNRGILVNTITDPEKGNLIVQASIEREQFAINISTFGQSPGFSRALREYLEDLLDEDLDRALAVYIEIRQWLFANEPDYEKRSECLHRLSLDQVRSYIKQSDLTNAEILERVKEWLSY